MCFDEVPQRFPGPFAEKLLIEGPGFHFTTCSLTSKEALANEQQSIFLGIRDKNESIFAKHNENVRFTFKYQVDLALHEN